MRFLYRSGGLAGRIAVLAFWAWILGTGSTFAAGEGFTILSQSDDGVEVEFTLPPFSVKPSPVSEPGDQEIAVVGWPRTVKTGAPLLPVTGVLLDVPETGDLSVEIVEAQWLTKKNIPVMPVPRWESGPDGVFAPVYEKDPASYSLERYPAETVSIERTGVLRNISTARLLLHPFSVDSKNKELNTLSHARIRVSFSGEATTKTLESDALTSILRGLVLNQVSTSASTIRAQVAAPADFDQGLRIPVSQTGIYRVTYEDMAQAGMNPASLAPDALRLLNQGSEVAITVSASGATLAPGDYVEFFGRPVNTPFTGTNVYWLITDAVPGPRIQTRDGSVSGQGQATTTFWETLHIEENLKLFETRPGAPDKDYWFWAKLTAPVTANYTVSIPSAVQNQNPAEVRVNVYGGTMSGVTPNHHMEVSLNGNPVADAYFSDIVEYTASGTVPQDALVDGDNTLTLNLPNDTGAPVDLIYFNYLEVDYERDLTALSDALGFTLTGNGLFEVRASGFASASAVILDVTDPENPVRITNPTFTPDAAGTTVSFDVQLAGDSVFFIAGTGAVGSPQEITLWQNPKYASPQLGADWILITAAEFRAAAQPLVDFRGNQNLRTISVSVEDLYNEFSDGLLNPQAIKSFLTYAYENWQSPAPSLVLLLGDANTDYRDFMGRGKKTYVPTHLSWTDGIGVTPDDGWYACVDGDDLLPDLFLGRVSADSATAAGNMAAKLVGYETGARPPAKALFVADNDEQAFEDINNALASSLPAQVAAEKVYLGDYPDTPSATNAILDDIDQGVFLTNYFGHGSVTNWSGEYLFDTADAALLQNNGKLPFFLLMTCLNGYFAHTRIYSLAETFVVLPDTGGIAAFAPSGLSQTWTNDVLEREIFERVFTFRTPLIGTVSMASKIAAYAKGLSDDDMRVFNLMGDPASRLGIPDFPAPGDMNGDGSINALDAGLSVGVLAGAETGQTPDLAGDVNGNGKVDAADALYVLQHMVEKRPYP